MGIRSFRRISWGTGAVLSLAVIAVVLLRPYMVPDWIKLYGYTPQAAVVTLAGQATMTDAARHLFYVNHASLEDKTNFRKNCPQAGEKTIIIGCYNPGQKGIHVLAVDDERLSGVEQVTAAHEMLHAAYERLSAREKAYVDAMLADYQHNGLKDQRVLAAIESYKKTEPGQELNEMHSMFGTEIADLPDELEQYYARYFTVRKTVVAFADAYQDAFTSRESQIEDYDSRLQTQEAQIQANTRSLEDQAADIERERARLDALLRQRDTGTYNDGVAPFNTKVAAYNTLLSQTRAMIDEYNAMVEKRNAIADQALELQQAIDSSSLPSSQ